MTDQERHQQACKVIMDEIDRLRAENEKLKADNAFIHEQLEAAKMTLRDEFAKAALGGLLADPYGPATKEIRLAEISYQYADAMLAAREAGR